MRGRGDVGWVAVLGIRGVVVRTMLVFSAEVFDALCKDPRGRRNAGECCSKELSLSDLQDSSLEKVAFLRRVVNGPGSTSASQVAENVDARFHSDRFGPAILGSCSCCFCTPLCKYGDANVFRGAIVLRRRHIRGIHVIYPTWLVGSGFIILKV